MWLLISQRMERDPRDIICRYKGYLPIASRGIYLILLVNSHKLGRLAEILCVPSETTVDK